MGTRVAGATVLAIWLAGVVFTAWHHEFWRDEVRALSLARAARSAIDLYPLVQYDGHPVLWYLMLFVGTSIVDTPLILPIVSIVVAFSAVALFLWRAPFALWLKGLFMFGALPFYEYAVVARNYGISMLLLFVAAVVYKDRFTHPVRLAVVLALLANTNVHSAILTTLISALWIWEVFRRREALREQAPSFVAGFLVIAAGLALCAVFAVPRENTVLVARGMSAQNVAGAVLRVATQPGEAFDALTPRGTPSWLTSILLFACVAGLATKPRLAVLAAGGTVLLGVLFDVVYPGAYRHQGLLLVFLVFLHWIAVDSASGAVEGERTALVRHLGRYGAMGTLMLAAFAQSVYVVRTDLRLPMSSNKALAEFLYSREYRDAILVAEPDYFVESLPYYARNRIYLPREGRFGSTVSWTTASKPRLSLAELVETARALQQQQRKPVLIVLGHREVRTLNGGTKRFPYQKEFVWTPTGRNRLAQSTRLVAEFASAVSEENYAVYALLPTRSGARVLATLRAPTPPLRPIR